MQHTTRSAAAATALTTTVLALLATVTAAGAARAHGGTLAVDIAGHEQGHVTTLVTWENDKDSVDERVAATVNAVSADGRRTAGPWMLVRDPSDEKRFTTAEALPPGSWKVSVEVGQPALGRDEADLTVAPAAPAKPAPAAPARPAAAAPDPSAPASAVPASAKARTEARPGLPVTATAALGTLLAGGAAAALVVRRRRRARA